MTTTQEWYPASDSAALKPGLHVLNVNKKKIVLAKLDAGVFAFDIYCPHVRGPMHRSEVNGCILTCPLHGWRFDLQRQGTEIHGYRTLQMFEVKESDGQYLVKL